ncbi:MaoC family dehydratase [Dethiobacter alkaliphilus]|uniref:MaoC domain protein dehydratase n=1 Tax=Dethiobacter alkaliphilus AHT 1 TaxID=555088 RepID=C0GGU6_DETAL|nr:MaoC family dehydratase [Dethiobacter alkaliphilus]EEG77537.1 MaoC domain protein dehydratase [Dethiobacter alkaliphilus AHT 1]
MVADLKYADIQVGDSASFSKTLAEADVYNFAGISGDFNPIHMDEEFAKTTRFGKRIAHGMVTASFISTLVGMYMPGRNALYLSQEMKFVKPVFIGDTLTATATVLEKIEEKRILVLETVIKNQEEQVVLAGKARVMKMEG